MVYALVRGWLAAMAAILIEILIAAVFFIPDLSSRSIAEGTISTVFPLVYVALLEESMKFFALRGISSETVPFFRNAIFKGILVGIGFALFEICVKILFHDQNTNGIEWIGALSGAIVHIVTGCILGTAWFLRKNNRTPIFFPALFIIAVLIHIFYNVFISPILFEKFS